VLQEHARHLEHKVNVGGGQIIQMGQEEASQVLYGLLCCTYFI
jgi:hypothetical protein